MGLIERIRERRNRPKPHPDNDDAVASPSRREQRARGRVDRISARTGLAEARASKRWATLWLVLSIIGAAIAAKVVGYF